MDDRLDLIIFGASGYTGRFVLPEMLRICQNYPNIRWAVAGRSREKLESALREASEKTGEDASSIPIICADVNDDKSLRAMCSQCKVIMNCCGPYLSCGEPVISAAIDTQTHYMDVCSEPPFLDNVLGKYDALARERSVFVINACGLGCIPVDLGVEYMQQQFQGTLNSVEAYLTTQKKGFGKWPFNVIRNSTWEGIIEDISERRLWGSKNDNTILIPKLKRRLCLHKRSSRWAIHHPGPEEAVVNRTQNYSKTRPVQFRRYQTFPSIFAAISTIFGGILMLILCRVLRLKGLFVKYARLMSLGLVTYGDPDENVMEKLGFDYELYGLGWKGKVEGTPKDKIVARVYPVAARNNAPYEGTAIAVIYAAIVLLTERDKIPSKYGVITPGTAFENTSIIDKYNKDRLKFEIIEN